MRLPPRSECLQLVEATAPNVNGQAASAASEQTLDNLARAIGCSWQLWQLLQWSNFASQLGLRIARIARREKSDTTRRRGPSAPGDLNAREAKKNIHDGASATTRRPRKVRLVTLSLMVLIRILSCMSMNHIIR